MNRPVDFTSATKVAFGLIEDISRASMTPTLSAKISSPSLSTTPQRSPSPSKAKPTSALARKTSSRKACSIFRSSVLGLYFGKVWSRLQSSSTTPQPISLRTCGEKAPAVPGMEPGFTIEQTAVPFPQAHTTFSLRLSLGRSVRSAI